jgi:hypothetical protein
MEESYPSKSTIYINNYVQENIKRVKETMGVQAQ